MTAHPVVDRVAALPGRPTTDPATDDPPGGTFGR
jgi:hypothetical protein